MLFGLSPISRSHQNALLHPSIPTAFQVNEFVANHVALREVDVELIAGLEEELWGRFASTAWRVGSFGRDVEFFDTNSIFGQFTGNMLVNSMHVLDWKIAAANARLIRNDEELEPRILQSL